MRMFESKYIYKHGLDPYALSQIQPIWVCPYWTHMGPMWVNPYWSAYILHPFTIWVNPHRFKMGLIKA